MSFINRVNDGVQTAALKGANAPREAIVRNALRVGRPPALIMPNNAPSQNLSTGSIGYLEQTPIQKLYVANLARNVENRPGQTSHTWIGQSFSPL